jgi:hypothetical protein
VQARRWSLHCLQLLACSACAKRGALVPIKTIMISDITMRIPMALQFSHVELLSLSVLK